MPQQPQPSLENDETLAESTQQKLEETGLIRAVESSSIECYR